MRVEEKKLIEDFLANADVTLLYISGIPGCGKTYLVKQFENIAYLNCMCDKFELSAEKVTVLDEVDHLSKSCWEQVKHHTLDGRKVIGIANTLDISCIPDDLVDSLEVLSFSPYTLSDIICIAQKISDDLDLEIDDKVLSLVARKCASIDGDIRRLTSWLKKLPESPTIADALAITKNSQISMFGTMPIHAKHLLCIIYIYFKEILYKEKRPRKVTPQNLYQNCKHMYLSKHSVPCPGFSEYMDLLNVLESKSFVNIKKGNIELDDKVEGDLFENDEVSKALYLSNSTLYEE